MKGLSKRQFDIIEMLAAGVSDLQVCRQLGILPAQLELALGGAERYLGQTDADPRRALQCERALRKKAENTARSLEARFHALLDASPEAVLVVNAMTGIIRQVNANAARLFGYSVDGLVGRPVEDLVPARYRAIHPAYRVGFISSVRKREMGYHPPIFGVREDGSEVEIAIALTATISDEDVMVVCTDFAQWRAGMDAESDLIEQHE